MKDTFPFRLTLIKGRNGTMIKTYTSINTVLILLNWFFQICAVTWINVLLYAFQFLYGLFQQSIVITNVEIGFLGKFRVPDWSNLLYWAVLSKQIGFWAIWRAELDYFIHIVRDYALYFCIHLLFGELLNESIAD